MAILKIDCPHCKTKSVAASVFGAVQWPRKRHSYPQFSIAATCPYCHRPIGAELTYKDSDSSSLILEKAKSNLVNGSYSVSEYNFRVDQTWPKASPPRIPDHLPPTVEKALRQAETNFPVPDHEEAAATMYRRALELALADRYPEVQGTLFQRIKQLVADRELPPSMGDWVDEVRVIGNNGAHEIDGVTQEDLKRARGFVDAALRYLITLPEDVRLRREGK